MSGVEGNKNERERKVDGEGRGEEVRKGNIEEKRDVEGEREKK